MWFTFLILAIVAVSAHCSRLWMLVVAFRLCFLKCIQLTACQCHFLANWLSVVETGLTNLQKFQIQRGRLKVLREICTGEFCPEVCPMLAARPLRKLRLLHNITQ